MITRNLALLAMVAGIVLPGAASAQKGYFARQKLMPGVSKPVYDGTWTSSSSTGACVAYRRQTVVTGTCTGGTCDPATDPSKTTETACGSSCTAMKPGFVYSPSSDPAMMLITGTSNADAIEKARLHCESETGAIACRFAIQGGDRSGRVVVYKTTDLKTENTTYSVPYYWYNATCRRP